MANTLGEIIESLKETPNKWEYKTIEGIPTTKLLNQMGIESWEMCGVCNPPHIKPIYYFKRKIQQG